VTFVARMRTVIEERPDHVEQLLVVIETINAQIKKADQQIAKIANTDELCRRLMGVPGVGPVTAVVFKAVLDDIGRFKRAHLVESYLGLVPGERSSGDGKKRTAITKAGSRMLRTLLIQAAWGARRSRKRPPMAQWSVGVEQRRGKHVAAVALARKLAGVLFAMWRNGTEYDMTRA